MLIKHVRLWRTKLSNGYRWPCLVPVATIVALSPEQIGVAVCCKKDQYNKKEGVKLAKERAESGEQIVVTGKVKTHIDWEIARLKEKMGRKNGSSE